MKATFKFSLTLTCLLFCIQNQLVGMFQETPSWADDLELEYLTPTILYSSLERPKLKLRVTNVSDEPIEYMGVAFRADGSPNNLPGCATFPNGGLLNLAPGESTIVSAWSACYFGDGIPFEEGTTDHVAEFQFSQNQETYFYRVNFQIVNDEDRESPASADGNDITISGRINIKGGYFPQVRLWAKTRHSLELEVQTEPDGEGQLSFSFAAQEGYDWYLVTQADLEGEEVVNFPKQTVAVNDFDDPEDIQIDIEALDYEYDVNFELRNAIVTPTGFWRGAVSESEETVVFIPGQENWAGETEAEKRVYKEQSTIYKYNFAGEKLWEYSPGYQCWGGDMARDGSKVLYQLVPNGGTYSIGMIDGFDGTLMWKRETQQLFPDGRPYEGLEARLSNNGEIAAIGVVSGFVSLIDANSGNIIRQFPNGPNGDDTWGQVRGIMFDAADEHVYVGSGDNYLRKVRVADGEVVWKAFIGGWPFVNGLTMSSDESFIITGTKSFDQARVNNETGETEWIKDYGSLEAALSLNDSLVINFGGLIMDAKTGEYVTSIRQGAESHFFAGDTLVARVDRNVAPYYTNGKSLLGSEPSGGGQGGGEQSQWSYMKPDGSLVIIAYRDMVTDPGNQVGIAFYTGDIQRRTLDPNDNPTDISLSATNIDENNNEDAEIGTLSTTDADSGDTFAYELIDGEGDTDNAIFSIDGDKLMVSNSLDFEEKSSYSIRIRTSDSNEARFSKVFTINVNDINDVPSELNIDNTEIEENLVSGTTIGSLTTTDDDANDSHSYSLVSGSGDDDNSAFTIDGTTLKSAESFNFESKDSYSILIRTDDGNGGTLDQQITVSINDVNDSPTDITLSSSSVDEGLDPGSAVGDFSSVDEDSGDSFTYTLVSGTGDTDNAEFSIANNQLLTASVFDFDVKDSYSIRIKTEDSEGASFEKEFTITIDLVTAIERDPELIRSVFPNPSSELINIEMASQAFPFNLKVFDMSGNLQTTKDSIFQRVIKLDISSLKEGIYLLTVLDDNGSFTSRKIIIQD